MELMYKYQILCSFRNISGLRISHLGIKARGIGGYEVSIQKYQQGEL